ncbi:MAG: ATPase, T2SS/T4P/T4SS family [bacterium]
MRVEDEQLKAFLEDSDLIKKQDLDKAHKQAKEKKQRLADALIKNNLINQEQLTKLYAYILGIPFISLEKEIVPIEVLQIIPEPIAKRHNIVAFKKTDNALEVAMLDPEDLQTIEFIKKKTNLKILPRLTTEKSISAMLAQYQKSLKLELEELSPAGIKIIKEAEPAGVEGAVNDQELEKIARDLPIIKVVDTILKHAILQGASDIHIEPLEKELIIRYRVDGVLEEAMTLPKQIHSGVVARIKILANLKLDEHRLPQDGRFKIESSEWKMSCRVSVLPIFDGEKVAIRFLSEDSRGLTMEKLGLFGNDLEIFHNNIQKPHGMLLVTGPTGCGKTTTLYTILDILNKPEVNIVTIEDPVEYRLPRINQTQTKPQIGYTFASGLRSLLRQDPDIIMVGEIRDSETANIAVNAALTGHLLLSTLHTNDTASSLPRLLDLGIEPFLLASTINLIVAQRLVRTFCPHKPAESFVLFKEQIKAMEQKFDMERILSILKKEKIIQPQDNWQTIKFYKPVPCKKCQDGYKGRIGIFEMIEVTEEIKKLVHEHASSEEIKAKAIEHGMIDLVQAGFIKAAQGITSIDEILKVTQE